MSTAPVTWLRLDQLHAEGLQARAEFDEAFAESLAQFLRDQKKKPDMDRKDLEPADVIQEGRTYWLWDGNHRRRGYEIFGAKKMPCVVRRGTYREAKLLCIGANVKNSIYRTTADKRRAVGMLLDDPEWSQWPAGKIADQAGVGETMVNDMKRERRASSRRGMIDVPEPITVERNGTTYTMQPRAPAPAPSATPAPLPVVLTSTQKQNLFLACEALVTARQALQAVGPAARLFVPAVQLVEDGLRALGE